MSDCFDTCQVSTSAGLLLPVLKDVGEESSRFGQLVMTAAALAEVGPIVLLSLFSSATSSTAEARLASLAILLVLLAVLGLALGRVRQLEALEQMLNRLEDRSAQLRVRASLTLALGFGVLALNFGFASILGAFAAGLLHIQPGSPARQRHGAGRGTALSGRWTALRGDLPGRLRAASRAGGPVPRSATVAGDVLTWIGTSSRGIVGS